ncbi:MAG: flagellar basal body rod protein FlgC [Pseudomonadota bacterium]
MDAMAISRTALDVEWQRLQVIAQNLANENTTNAGGDGPYRPLRLVSGPDAGFEQLVDANGVQSRPVGVRVVGLEPLADGARRVHDPAHPHADADGFVTYPNLDRAAEMTLLIRTSRAYEANLTAMTIAQQMYMRALDLGRR